MQKIFCDICKKELTDWRDTEKIKLSWTRQDEGVSGELMEKIDMCGKCKKEALSKIFDILKIKP